MANKKGKKPYNLRRAEVKLLQRNANRRRYFYVDGNLYRAVAAPDRANDFIRAWSYTDKRVVQFVWSDIQRNSQQAFDTSEVAILFNRSKKSVLEAITKGAISPPYKMGQHMNSDEKYRFGQFKWSEDDVLALHEYYLTLGRGRPRKDGILYSAPRIPTRLELLAMMKQNKMYYVQAADGSFVPIFDQPDWT